jgi:hypothetical protein
MALTTPGETGESPAPQIKGGDRGSGTTVLGANDSSTTGSTVPSGLNAGADLTGTDLEGKEGEISALAYECWCDRGCPLGSPEVDWQNAIEKYRASKGGKVARSAGA